MLPLHHLLSTTVTLNITLIWTINILIMTQLLCSNRLQPDKETEYDYDLFTPMVSPVFLSTRQLKESELWAELRRVAKSWGLSPWQPICSATGRPTTCGFTLQMSRFYDLLVVENHWQIITNHRSKAGYSKYSEILATNAAPVFLKFEIG